MKNTNEMVEPSKDKKHKHYARQNRSRVRYYLQHKLIEWTGLGMIRLNVA